MNKRLMTGFGALAIGVFYCQAQSNVSKPNVVIIYADDVGYGDIRCNGSNTIQTPNVDKVAASGLSLPTLILLLLHLHRRAIRC